MYDLDAKMLNNKAAEFLKKRSNVLIPILIFILPFLYFFRQVAPIKGKYIAIINDFDTLYYAYKVYLIDCLSHFYFPFWSPSEAAGFPFYSNPFAAAFYPLNILLVLFYKLAGGYTRLDHQIFTVFGVAIFGLGLYFWLRKTTLNLRSILFASSIMCVSFKVAEILRFPNAVHTAAWYPWILFCITSILLSQSLKKSLQYGGLLVFFTICFLTGGYPYYIYYSIFLFFPYCLLLLIPSLRKLLFNVPKIKIISILVLFTSGLVGSLVCLPYLYKMSQLLKNTTDRGGGDFGYSTSHLFNFEDTLGSWFFPPASQTEGWYYFSALGIFIILIYILDSLLGNAKKTSKHNSNPNENINYFRYRNICLISFFLVWIGLISYITYGRESYLFYFLWKYMPSFSNLRVWGRMNIILVPIICLLLAISYQNLESKIIAKENFLKKTSNLVFLFSYAIVISIQFFFYKNERYDHYWNTYFTHVASKDIGFIVFGAISFLTIIVILIVVNRVFNSKKSVLTVMTLGLALLAIVDMSSVGNKMWILQKWNGSEWLPEIQLLDAPERKKLDILDISPDSFTIPRTEHAGIAFTSQFNVGIMPNWYFQRYVQFLDQTESEPESRDRLLGKLDGTKIYFSESNEYPSIQEFLHATKQSKNQAKILTYTGNRLVLEVDMKTSGYVHFIDNWDSDWQVTIDGESSSLEKLFGTFKSVYVNSGKHKLIFSYSPGFF